MKQSMLMKMKIAVFFVLFTLSTSAQEKQIKPLLNMSAVENSWSSLDCSGINSTGEYVYYTIRNAMGNLLVLCSTDGSNTKTFAEFDNFQFSTDGLAFLVKTKDTLIIYNLRNFAPTYLENVQSFRLVSSAGGEALIYKTNDNKLTVSCLFRQSKYTISNVVEYNIELGNKVFFVEKEQTGSAGIKAAYIVNLWTGKETKLWSGLTVLAKNMDRNGKKIIFLTEENKIRKFYEYYVDEHSLSVALDSTKLAQLKNYEITGDGLQFDYSGNSIIFNLKLLALKKMAQPIGVDIWNYKDIFLQPEQMSGTLSYNTSENSLRKAVYNLRTRTLRVLGEKGEYIFIDHENTFPKENALVLGRPGPDAYYKEEQAPYLDVINIHNGNRTHITGKGSASFGETLLSPDGRYVVWFDTEKLTWFSFDLTTNLIINLSSSVPFKLYDEYALNAGRKGAWGMAGWLPAEKSILLYDEFDIWKVDLSGNTESLSLTQGHGRRMKITLNLVSENFRRHSVMPNESVLIAGYDRKTKDGGYWRYTLNKKFSLDLSHLQSYSISSRTPLGFVTTATAEVKKALMANVYMVCRERADFSRNVFVTHDFVKYNQISDIRPEKKYNWLTAELVHWTLPNQQIAQGILYKPENFIENKAYPLILNYYEKRSDELHKFIKPEYSEHNINIPLFVSEGYLVFIPDMNLRSGENGKGVVETVESAVNHLTQLRYVNTNKIGLQGHSFGGWETNYIITHSNKFTAACEFAGVSNTVSSYGQLGYSKTTPRQALYEVSGQGSGYGVGVTPWTHTDIYIKNSPVFNIGTVTTPLLMVHNKEDGAVPFEQAIEMFMGLRRAGKKVWLLQYDQNYHWLSGEAAKDYHTRMVQFFNYYLKAELAPIWMTQGIEAKNKGEVNGLDYDKAGVMP